MGVVDSIVEYANLIQFVFPLAIFLLEKQLERTSGILVLGNELLRQSCTVGHLIR